MNKFKTVSDLEKAYLELEKRFTQKCQQLAKLQNEIEGINVEKTTSPEQAMEKLFSKYANAKSFSRELSEALAHSDNVGSPFGVEQCYLDVLDKNYLNVANLNDEKFLQQYVVDNPTVVNAVLQKVFVSETQAPKTISGNGGHFSVMPRQNPTTMKEANALAKELLN